MNLSSSFIKSVLCFQTLFLLASCDSNQKPKTDQEKMAYSLGFQAGESLRNKNLSLSTEITFQGFQDGLNGRSSNIEKSELQGALYAAQQQFELKRLEQARLSLDESKKWFEQQELSGDWKKHPSGFLYKEKKKGSGPIPTAQQKVKIHYEGKLPSGAIFDSTYIRGQPALLTVNSLIPGWRSALLHMPVGSEWEIVIPAELGYKEFGNDLIPPNANLIIEVKLIEIR